MTGTGLKAIIFDMDGVLVDSEPLHLEAMQKLMGGFGIAYTEKDNSDFLGRKDLVIAEILIAKHNFSMSPQEFVDAKEEILRALVNEKAIARPGVNEILESAKKANLSLALASSATRGTIELVLERLSIAHFFERLCSGDDVRNGKPAPDIFLLAAELLGVEAKECMVIEDTINGLKAAKAAGMYAVSIPCDATRHQDHSIADLNLRSLLELSVEEIFGYNSQN